MTDDSLVDKTLRTLQRPDGNKALRPVHSLGISATGQFLASPVAREFCTAQHFNAEPVDVITRFSNGSGCAVPHDGWSDVRGMATRFFLKDMAPTDLVAMTLPEFFSSTPEKFLDFAIAAQPTPVHWESPWKKFLGMLHLVPPLRNPYPGETISPDAGAMAYADKVVEAQLAVFNAAQIGAPVSYARASYHAVHTFIVTGADGVRRWVRFTWEPIAGVLNTDPKKTPKDVYLHKELRERLAEEEVRFSLMMTIGETGDAFDNPTRAWPPHRKRVVMGELTLDAVPEDQEAECEKLSFNPCLLTEGIEVSDDPVLQFRKDAYQTSSKWRHATPCPFAKGE